MSWALLYDSLLSRAHGTGVVGRSLSHASHIHINMFPIENHGRSGRAAPAPRATLGHWARGRAQLSSAQPAGGEEALRRSRRRARARSGRTTAAGPWERGKKGVRRARARRRARLIRKIASSGQPCAGSAGQHSRAPSRTPGSGVARGRWTARPRRRPGSRSWRQCGAHGARVARRQERDEIANLMPVLHSCNSARCARIGAVPSESASPVRLRRHLEAG